MPCMRRHGARSPSIVLQTHHGLALQVDISIDEVGTAVHNMGDLISEMRSESEPNLHDENWSRIASALADVAEQAGFAVAQLRQRIPLLLRTTAVLNKILDMPLKWHMRTTSNDDGWWSTTMSALLPKDSDVQGIEAILTRTFPRI